MKSGIKLKAIIDFDAHISDEQLVTIPKGSILTKIDNTEDDESNYSERFNFNGMEIDFSTYQVRDVLIED